MLKSQQCSEYVVLAETIQDNLDTIIVAKQCQPNNTATH